MGISRRVFLKAVVAGAAALPAGAAPTAAAPAYRRISCEEAFTLPEIVEGLKRLAGGVPSMRSGPIAGPFMPNLLDLGQGRIAQMDRDGVDLQILSLTSPGVQLFPAGEGIALARLANDRLAAAVQAHPDRYAGMATLAPQAPEAAAAELTRTVRELGFKGAMINSHTNGEYLDQEKYRPILAAAQELDVPIYLHPRDPAPGMAGPLDIPGFAVGWGYAVETGTHALKLIAAGIFERFPRLTIVLGHLGETLPFLLDRIDNRYRWQMDTFGMAGLPRLPGDYFRTNFVITTSGMNYAAPVQAAIAALGADKVLFAADYPMESQADAVRDMEAIPLPADVKRMVFEDNARRVFRL